MNDLPPLWQIAPVAVLVVWVGVWLVKRVMTLLRSAFDGQGRKGFLAAFDSSSLARSIATSASSATAIRKALAKRLTRIFNLMFYIPTFQRPSASLFIGARAR